MNPILEDEEFLADLADEAMSQRQIAGKWGIAQSTVNKYRQRLRNDFFDEPKASITAIRKPAEKTTSEQSTDGSRSTEFIRDRPVTLEDARKWIRSSGDDPDDYELSVRSIAYGQGQSSNKMSAIPKRKKAEESQFPDISELLESLNDYHPPARQKSSEGGAFVICPADMQAGKGDYGLDHNDLAGRVMLSWARAAEFCREYQPSEILIAELGDSVENFNSTSSQRGTNTLALTEQIRLARRLLLEGIKQLAPLAPKLTYAAVPSNHGSVRVSMKNAENHALDDFGIEIAEQIRDVVYNAPALDNVVVAVPETPNESLCIDIAGTSVGMSHGHLANNADGLSKFWQGQSHGRMPLGDADIALFGHFHSLRVQQSGDARWLMVSPSSDNGSSWWTAKTGERSTAGMLSFTTADKKWSNLAIL